MHLWLVRHGPALAAGPGEEDAARALTPDAPRVLEATARRIAAAGLPLERILHSPWTRARATALLLAPLAGGRAEEEPLLARGPGPALCERLAGLERDGAHALALVGHQPWMGELLALLVTGDARHGRGFRVAKAGLAELEGEARPGRMRLRALWRPGGSAQEADA